MLTTEAEAKSKRCHAGYAASSGVTDGASCMSTAVPVPPMYAAYGGSNGAYGVQTASAPLCCIGSACMAWRWAFTANPVTGIEQTDRGYCGLAGQATGIVE